MSASDSYMRWKMAYEITPIILYNGIATSQGNNGLPIVVLTNGTGNAQTINTATPGQNITVSSSAAANADYPNLDGFAVHYRVLPGSSLIANQVATYPFANQAVAANALIAQPLNVSMLMVCPASGILTYGQRQQMITSLQQALSLHNSLGGTYNVITPAYTYTNCLLLNMRDVTPDDGKKAQEIYQLDFYQPLISLQAAQQAYNGLTQQFAKGTPPQTGTPTAPNSLPVTSPFGSITQNLPPAPLL